MMSLQITIALQFMQFHLVQKKSENTLLIQMGYFYRSPLEYWPSHHVKYREWRVYHTLFLVNVCWLLLIMTFLSTQKPSIHLVFLRNILLSINVKSQVYCFKTLPNLFRNLGHLPFFILMAAILLSIIPQRLLTLILSSKLLSPLH